MVAVADKRRVIERRRDFRRRIAVDVALALADVNAVWGDYDRALEHLSSADQIAGGAISPRMAGLRDTLIREAAESH
jgi:hypothetical protein